MTRQVSRTEATTEKYYRIEDSGTDKGIESSIFTEKKQKEKVH